MTTFISCCIAIPLPIPKNSAEKQRMNGLTYDADPDTIKFLGNLAIITITITMCLFTVFFLIIYFGGVNIDSNATITKHQLLYIVLGIVLPLFVLACFSSLLLMKCPAR